MDELELVEYDEEEGYWEIANLTDEDLDELREALELTASPLSKKFMKLLNSLKLVISELDKADRDWYTGTS